MLSGGLFIWSRSTADAAVALGIGKRFLLHAALAWADVGKFGLLAVRPRRCSALLQQHPGRIVGISNDAGAQKQAKNGAALQSGPDHDEMSFEVVHGE
jgi:hypothetical protein